MTPNNNLSILPFYSDVSKQNHRKDYAFGEIYPLFTPDRKILPFQILREHRSNSITNVQLYSFERGVSIDITSQMLSSGLIINQYTSLGYDVIMYHGKLLLPISTPEGNYYIQISDGVQTWHSEVFNIVRSIDSLLQISYWDENSLFFNNGQIVFTNAFKFQLYLPTQIGRPDYEFDEQIDKRDGYQFFEKQISEKTYKFNFVAPEYLLDAMRIIRMMDNVIIINKGETYNVDQFLMTPKWQDGGYLAAVEAEFQCDTVIKKIGRNYLSPNMGDFNNDFNDDFKNS